MTVLFPDILEESRQLSPAASASILCFGIALWLFGWKGHRFWIVLVASVSAGVWGLRSAPMLGSQPLVAGLLLAASVGMLALAMVRVLAFAVGGTAAWLAIRALSLPWQEPLLVFLCGGVAGVLLLRLLTMIVTSSLGSLLIFYGGLSLADQFGKLQAVALATNDATMLTGAWGGLAFLGVIIQLLIDRAKRRPVYDEEEEERRLTRAQVSRMTRSPRLLD